MNLNEFLLFIFNFIKDIEFISVIFGLISVILIIKENKLCWFFGIINVILLSYVFFEKKIYGQFVLQIFFLVLQFYGLFYWNQKETLIKIIKISKLEIIVSICVILIFHFPLKFFLYSNIFENHLQDLDILITTMSLVAQFYQARKILENWLIWIFVDILSIYLFFESKLYMVMIFYISLLCIATIGYFIWKKKILSFNTLQ